MTEKIIIDSLVKDELEKMCKKYGGTFNSEHEAFAVTQEEIEEARDNIVLIDTHKARLWNAVKKNQPALEDWQLMHEYTVGAIQELIQVAACCIKATRQKAAE
jgi:hypothetical protein